MMFGEEFEGESTNPTVDPPLEACEEGRIVRLRGLPFEITEQQILDFFSFAEIEVEKIRIVNNSQGDAFVTLKLQKHVQSATEQSNRMIDERYIVVWKASLHDVQHADYQLKHRKHRCDFITRELLDSIEEDCSKGDLKGYKALYSMVRDFPTRLPVATRLMLYNTLVTVVKLTIDRSLFHNVILESAIQSCYRTVEHMLTRKVLTDEQVHQLTFLRSTLRSVQRFPHSESATPTARTVASPRKNSLKKKYTAESDRHTSAASPTLSPSGQQTRVFPAMDPSSSQNHQSPQESLNPNTFSAIWLNHGASDLAKQQQQLSSSASEARLSGVGSQLNKSTITSEGFSQQTQQNSGKRHFSNLTVSIPDDSEESTLPSQRVHPVLLHPSHSASNPSDSLRSTTFPLKKSASASTPLTGTPASFSAPHPSNGVPTPTSSSASVYSPADLNMIDELLSKSAELEAQLSTEKQLQLQLFHSMSSLQIQVFMLRQQLQAQKEIVSTPTASLIPETSSLQNQMQNDNENLVSTYTYPAHGSASSAAAPPSGFEHFLSIKGNGSAPQTHARYPSRSPPPAPTAVLLAQSGNQSPLSRSLRAAEHQRQHYIHTEDNAACVSSSLRMHQEGHYSSSVPSSPSSRSPQLAPLLHSHSHPSPSSLATTTTTHPHHPFLGFNSLLESIEKLN
eukprot:GCRY01002390.1.p1 GENE.GCRY01002390.1~~GCRY01002390.1.p1  ORF type:complete len:678 (-),score=103.54 GCRY01002390.1:973-3006(-)